MGKQMLGPCRIARAAAALGIAGLVAACAAGPPAPVILNGAAPGIVGETPVVTAPPPTPGYPGESQGIVVRPGESVSRLAQQYHVPERAIIAANHLQPPYKIETGQKLLIPGAARRPAEAANGPMRARPVAANHQPPEIIPLDGPAPPEKSAARSPAVVPLTAPSPQEPSAAEEARADSSDRSAELPHGGQLPWPVHGRILASYGVAAGGRRNDGINIAAPRGAPVKAVEGGIVAYAGNELRGYGNLVLIKHPDGFISAYAHCEELLVTRGERVTRGQVIAKVGATGGVGEPQLHFELRRGEHAVDPRAFLAPAPSAEGRGTASAG